MPGQRTLFVDRDGTLIREPADHQVDRIDKVRLVPGVIAALQALQRGGYTLVIVSNQDGLGNPGFPESDFLAANEYMLDLFASQGIAFAEMFFCPHTADDACACRKPKAGLLVEYLRNTELDRQASAVIGDRDTDLELAANLGMRGFRIDADGGVAQSWSYVVRDLLDLPRTARAHRHTNETSITVSVDLDQAAPPSASTGIGFFDHMLEQIAKHAGIGLVLHCEGDLEVDEHHTVEDVALCLGEALREALQDKRGIARYGFVLPMDESEAQVSLDLSGRPFFVFNGELKRESVGGLHTEMVPHFFRSLSQSLGAALHLTVRGENTHHMVESLFKAVGRTLRQAIARSGSELPSTKGVL